MADSSQQSITITAPADRVAAVITDFAAYPEWVSAVKQAEVLERYPDGRARQVHFVLDAGVVKDDYVLAYDYAASAASADGAWRIEWNLVRSQTQQSQHGSYELVEKATEGAVGVGSAVHAANTVVTYTLAVELNIPMLGMFKRKAEKMIMDAALRDLKKRVESLPSTGG